MTTFVPTYIKPTARLDPFAHMLRSQWQLTPAKFAIIATSVCFIGGFVTSAVNDLLIMRTNTISFLQDWSAWFWILVLTPFISGYYLWAPYALGPIFGHLQVMGIVSMSNAELVDANNEYNRPYLKYIAAGVAVCAGVLFFQARANLLGWAANGPLSKGITTALYMCGVYITLMLVSAFVINARVLRQVFRDKEFHVNLLHPDRCGGLRILSDYSLKTAYLIAVFGVLLSVSIFRFAIFGAVQDYWYILFTVPLYLILSAVCFFVPLGTAHVGMRKAKERLLESISQQFQRDYSLTHGELSNSSNTLKERLDKIEHLQRLYEVTDRFPVWPFDVQTLRRFTISTFAPLIPPMIGFAVEYLRKLIP